MSGKELIKRICELLREDDILLYDSHIVQKIESLTQRQLTDLINDEK